MINPMVEPLRRRRRRQTVLLFAAIAGVIALVLWLYLRTVPAGPARGVEMSGGKRFTVNNKAAPLRIATFNIHGGRDASGEGSLGRTINALADGRWDLLALQEVRGRDGDMGQNQAQLIGDALTMNWLFAPTERRRGRDDFGNGFLSAIRIEQWERIPLPREHSRAYRNYVVVRFDWMDKPVTCISTHIDSTGDRDAQLARVAEAWLALPPPCILMGDLNAQINHPSIQRLLSAPGVIEPVSKASGKARSGLDWIFVRGFEVKDAGVVVTDASDHPIVWAELTLPD